MCSAKLSIKKSFITSGPGFAVYFVSYHTNHSHLGSSIVPEAKSVILGYFIFFLSISSCDHSNSFNKLASFGVASTSKIAALSSLAT